MADIAPDTAVSKLEIPDRIKDAVAEMRGEIGVYIAEDSLLLRNLIKECLNKAGYTRMEVFSDGKQLWDKLCEDKENGTVDDNVNCVITDIEMPVMDGHRLVKLIKDDNELKKLPTIIFSSLINDEMKRKGAKLGADFQISKPEIGQLVDGMDMLLGID
jgi:two-component system chemotaxis response regulator CheV